MDNPNQEQTLEVINQLPDIDPLTTPKQRKTISKYDVAALTLKKQFPSMTPHAIGEALIKHGFSVNKNTIYKRLRKSDYLNAEFKRLEVYNREQLVREDFPLARKKLRNVLKTKDKSVPAAVQVQAAKIIYDKALADRQDKHPESPVIIENIERLQVLVQGDVNAE